MCKWRTYKQSIQLESSLYSGPIGMEALETGPSLPPLLSPPLSALPLSSP
jgi:hypothetical protein